MIDEELVVSLRHSLTPSSSDVHSIEVASSSTTYGSTLLKSCNLAENEQNVAAEVFARLFYSLSSVSGICSTNCSPDQVPQKTLTYASIITFSDYINTLLSSLPNFADDLKKCLDSFVAGGTDVSSFELILRSLPRILVLIRATTAHFDAESSPVGFTSVSEQMDDVLKSFADFVQLASDTFKLMAEGGEYGDYYDKFVSVYTGVESVVSQLTATFTELASDASKLLQPPFIEEPYNNFASYLSAISKHVSTIMFSSFVASLFGECKLEIHNEASKSLHKLVSKSTAIMRFRGPLEERLNAAQSSASELQSQLRSLLEPLTSTDLVESLQKTLTPSATASFQAANRLLAEFSARQQIMLEALRKDRRFSSFSQLPETANSTLTASAEPLITDISELVCYLMKERDPLLIGNKAVAAAVEKSVNNMKSNLASFLEIIEAQILADVDPISKRRHSGQKSVISSSCSTFIDFYPTYISKWNNCLYHSKAASLSAFSLLSLLCLDPHPIINRHLQELHPILAKCISFYFSNTLNVTINLVSELQQGSDCLPKDDRNRFKVVFRRLMKYMGKAATSNGSSSDPVFIAECCHGGDRIIQASYSLIETLQNIPNNELNMKCAVDFLKIFADTFLLNVTCYRLCLQVQILAEARSLSSQLAVFVSAVRPLFAQLSDELFAKFVVLESEISAGLAKLDLQTADSPPFGVYDEKYVNTTVECLQSVIVPCISLIQLMVPHLAAANPQIKKCLPPLTTSVESIKSVLKFSDSLRVDSISLLTGLRIQREISALRHYISNGSRHNIVSAAYGLASLLPPSLSTISVELKNKASELNSADDKRYSELIKLIQSDIDQISPSTKELTAEIDSQVAESQKYHIVNDEGEIKNRDGNAFSGLDVDRIPTDVEIADIFICINSNDNMASIKQPLNVLIDALNAACAKYKEALEGYDGTNKDLTELNFLGKQVQRYLDGVNKGLTYADVYSTKEDLEVTTRDINPEQITVDTSVTKSIPIAFTLAKYVSTLDAEKIPSLQIAVAESFKDAISTELSEVQIGFSKLLAVSDVAIKGAEPVMQSLFSRSRDISSLIDFQRIIPVIITVESLHRATTETSKRFQDDIFALREELQSLLTSNAQPERISATLRNFEAAVNCSDNDPTEESRIVSLLDDESLADRSANLSQEVTALIGTALTEKKKSNPDLALLKELQHKICIKSVAVITSTLTAAKRRAAKIKGEDMSDIGSQIALLLTSLEQFNKSTDLRSAARSQREVTTATSELSALCDTVIEIETTDEEHYNGDAIEAWRMVSSLYLVGSEETDSKDILFNRVSPVIQSSINTFCSRVTVLSKGTDGADEIHSLLEELQKQFSSLTASESKPGRLGEIIRSIHEIRCLTDDALSDEVTADPTAAEQLPFRFTVCSARSQGQSLEEIHLQLNESISQLESSYQELVSGLNSSRSVGTTLISLLNSFHGSASYVLNLNEILRLSVWTPASQNRLFASHSSLVACSDTAIDAVRSRLLVTTNWRQIVAEFSASCIDSITAIKKSAESAFQTAQRDLSATNDAEKELILAAQSIQQSQNRLVEMKAQAKEALVKEGANYLGVDIVEISAPILGNAARLIEKAQEQTKYVLKLYPDLENKTGLVNTARNLVDSLDLILVAAESVVNNDSDAIPKVLAACNLISSAIAHFVAESRQKNGSYQLELEMIAITDQIQETINRLRVFGREALEREGELDIKTIMKGGKAISSMVGKLNAEAKVNEALKDLEEAENHLKKTRRGKK